MVDGRIGEFTEELGATKRSHQLLMTDFGQTFEVSKFTNENHRWLMGQWLDVNQIRRSVSNGQEKFSIFDGSVVRRQLIR
jgi:hypothetical protein